MRRASALLLVVGFWGCASTPSSVSPQAPLARDTHEGLQTALWAQTSAELWAASTMAYRVATRQLDAALADPSWTAAREQEGAEVEGLPEAVILDLDETVLDNSPFQARLAADRTVFTPALWRCWVEQKSAQAMPGAKEFLEHARARGVEVVYVTNRSAAEEPATLANLEALGLPVQRGGESILSKGERPEWTSHKTSRREEVARTHRILLLVGDDLGDFLAAARDAPAARRAAAREAEELWGTRWILLPNSQYGSWEGSLYGFDHDLPDQEVLEIKFSRLRPFDAGRCSAIP